MKRTRIFSAIGLGLALVGSVGCFCQVYPAVAPHAADKAVATSAGWDPQAAARYLDSREIWWQGWDHAKRDHDTVCVSCHTQVPYALARQELFRALGEKQAPATEQTMVSNIARRVRDWDEMQPFYSDAHSGPGKSVESRNAESVLNAVMLAFSDARAGTASDLSRMAFDHAWALQSKDGPTAGAWVWQNFHLTPWESPESEYYWAAMMAVAAGKEPDLYRQDDGVKDHVAALNDYLRGHYDAQPLLNKLILLWASHWFPDLLTTSQREALLGLLYTLQRPDGGWSLADLGTWKRIDGTPEDTRPDACATGLVVLVLEEAVDAGPRAEARAEEHIEKGIAWLKANQDKSTGAWPAWSLNKNRDPNSPAGPFMSDAATGYAVMALEGWPARIVYRNAQYGFCFSLPGSWQGYSVINEHWSGTPLDDPKKPTIEGPQLRIRNPNWTEANPYEDIPIMIFTQAQWKLAESDGYAFSAAPIGPGEIARNAHYVFALPARYNYDLAIGFRQVDDLIQQKSLQAPCGNAAAGKARASR
ncbi:MAG: hypothetical protein WBC92_05895 [Terracidiphilus sp.]